MITPKLPRKLRLAGCVLNFRVKLLLPWGCYVEHDVGWESGGMECLTLTPLMVKWASVDTLVLSTYLIIVLDFHQRNTTV